MGRVVIHADLCHHVAFVAASGEHDTPVEGTTSGQADSIDIDTIVIVIPVTSAGLRARTRSITTIGVEAVFEHPFDMVALVDGVHSNFVNRSPVIARFVDPFNRLAPCAEASGVHASNLAEVVFTFNQRSVVRLVGRQLAERINRVVVEDRHTVDAGAHHLIIFKVTVAALGATSQLNVVDVDFVLVVAVEVTEGDVDILASVSAQVDAV